MVGDATTPEVIDPMKQEQKIGLSLGGGGARGLAHVVVLEVIDELGVKIDALSGSSIGALIGMGYAGGLSGRELRAHVLETFSDRAKVFSKIWSLRPSTLQGWFDPKNYTPGQISSARALELFTPIANLPSLIEDLPLPLTVIATDYYEWKEVAFRTGELKEAVAASIAIPFIFRPVKIGARVLIDGNITNPLPFEHLPGDIDKVIAVDVVGGPETQGSKIPTGYECMLGANQIMMQAITREKIARKRPPDLVIRPPINNFGVLDFLKASTILRLCDGARSEMKRSIEAVVEAKARH